MLTHILNTIFLIKMARKSNNIRKTLFAFAKRVFLFWVIMNFCECDILKLKFKTEIKIEDRFCRGNNCFVSKLSF